MESRVIASIVVVVGLTACGTSSSKDAPALTDAEKTAIHEAIVESRATIDASDVAFREAIAARVLPAPDAQPCTTLDFHRERLQTNYQSWGGWLVSGRQPTWPSTPYPLTMAAVGDPTPEHSAEGNHRLAQLKRVEGTIDMEDRPKVWDYDYLLRESTIEPLYSIEIYFESTVAVDAKRTGTSSAVGEFEGGAYAGIAWIYDQDEKRIVCGGEVTAVSSTMVDLGYKSLTVDLFVNLVRQLPFGLRQTAN